MEKMTGEFRTTRSDGLMLVYGVPWQGSRQVRAGDGEEDGGIQNNPAGFGGDCGEEREKEREREEGNEDDY